MSVKEYNLSARGSSGTKRYAWMTDLHLNFAEPAIFEELLTQLTGLACDGVFITGDISDGWEFATYLTRIANEVQKPIHFVLGNHDHYDRPIAETKEFATKLAQRSDLLVYSTMVGVTPLTDRVALIGHDGWSDGRCGDFLTSDVRLNDYIKIPDLANIEPEERLSRLMALGSTAGDVIGRRLKKALKDHYRVIILTHSPPFREASRYEDHDADDNWGPHFVCQAMGDVIRPIMKDHPNHDLVVLCGHSHHGADQQVMPNVRVVAGKSRTGIPRIQGVVTC